MSIIIIAMSVIGAYLAGRYSSISYYEERLNKLRDDYFTLRRRHYLTVMEMERDEEQKEKQSKSSAQSYWEAEDEFHINHTE